MGPPCRFRRLTPHRPLPLVCTSTTTSFVPFSAFYVLLTSILLYLAAHGFNYKHTCCLTPSPAPRVEPDAGSAPADYPEGTVLLDTHMHYGEISYDDEHVQSWDQRWRPSEKTVQDLGRDWRSIPVAKVLFITNGVGGVKYKVKPRKEGFWQWLCALFILCLWWCFEKIKVCVIACLYCFWGMLVLFYDWLREKCQTRR